MALLLSSPPSGAWHGQFWAEKQRIALVGHRVTCLGFHFNSQVGLSALLIDIKNDIHGADRHSSKAILQTAGDRKNLAITSLFGCSPAQICPGTVVVTAGYCMLLFGMGTRTNNVP